MRKLTISTVREFMQKVGLQLGLTEHGVWCVLRSGEQHAAKDLNDTIRVAYAVAGAHPAWAEAVESLMMVVDAVEVGIDTGVIHA